MRGSPHLTRRHALALAASGLVLPRAARASAPREVMWDELIPPGIPYPQIIGEGEIDYINDTWFPVYEESARQMNPALDGAYVKMPGYVVPLEMTEVGVTEFILVPYVGACIHVPPPPANQLVFVTSQTPWPFGTLWEAIWVIGQMRANLRDFDLAQVGYEIQADDVSAFTWPDEG